MIKKFKLSAGFTLIEMMLYMALLGFLMITMTELFAGILDVRSESATTSAVEQDGRFLLSRFVYDIQQASFVSTPASDGNSGNSLTLVIGGVNYTYSVVNGNLQIVNNFGTDILNSSETSISNLTFQRAGNTASGGKTTVQTTFTVTSTGLENGRTQQKTFSTTAGLR